MKIFPFLKKESAFKETPLQQEAEEVKSEVEQAAAEEIEEEAAESGKEPDMRMKVTTEDVFTDTPEGGLEEEIIEIDPEKGILRTNDIVKNYGKRTVANRVSIYVNQG